MAAGYQYKLLNGDSELTIEEDSEVPKRSNGRTILLVLTFLTMFMGVIGLLIILVFRDQGTTYGKAAAFTVEKHCDSPSCIQTSSDILNSMDVHANPCDDMYQYACGGWLKDQFIPPSRARWNRFSEVHKQNGRILKKHLDDGSNKLNGQDSTAIAKLKSFYRTCMDMETLDSLGASRIEKVIRKFGGWSITPDRNTTWNESSWNFQYTLTAMHKSIGSSFFGFGIGKDSKDTSQIVIKFLQSGLSLNSPNSYTNNNSKEFKEAFLKFASDLGVLLGGEKTDVRTKMEQVYNFEKELANINIKDYLNSFFKEHSFLPSDTIIVSTPDYFEKVGAIIGKTEKETLVNYMMWNFMSPLIGYLPNRFAETSLSMAKVLGGITSLPERWEKCFSISADVVGFAASALFVKDNFKPSSKEQVVKALHQVTKQFLKSLQTVSWLDDSTRANLKAKAEVLSYKVGYPDWIIDPKALDNYYEKLSVKEGEFLENRLLVADFTTDLALSKYGKPPDNSEWPTFPHTVNAFYDVQNNQVVVPAGILQPPFFSPHFPKPFLYSTIGMVVGHELTHGFDNRGRMFDKNGNLAEQWTNTTSSEFEKKANCMVDQYGSYTLHDHHMNGRLTLGENIADNGGLLFAYNAFKDDDTMETVNLPGIKLKDDQLFFLGFSQIWCGLSKKNYEINSIQTATHPLGKMRVKGVLSNLPQFAAAYNCPEKSPMVPKERCKVW